MCWILFTQVAVTVLVLTAAFVLLTIAFAEEPVEGHGDAILCWIATPCLIVQAVRGSETRTKGLAAIIFWVIVCIFVSLVWQLSKTAINLLTIWTTAGMIWGIASFLIPDGEPSRADEAEVERSLPRWPGDDSLT